MQWIGNSLAAEDMDFGSIDAVPKKQFPSLFS
jgi:hypothetical protein